MWPPSIAYLTRHGNCWMSFLFVLYSALRFLSQIHEILSFQEKLYKVPTAICRVSVLIFLSLMYSISRYYISFNFRNFSMTFLRWDTNTSCTVVIHLSCLLTNRYLHISVYIHENENFFFCKQRGSVFPPSLRDFNLVITSFSPMDICKHGMNHDYDKYHGNDLI